MKKAQEEKEKENNFQPPTRRFLSSTIPQDLDCCEEVDLVAVAPALNKSKTKEGAVEARVEVGPSSASATSASPTRFLSSTIPQDLSRCEEIKSDTQPTTTSSSTTRTTTATGADNKSESQSEQQKAGEAEQPSGTTSTRAGYNPAHGEARPAKSLAKDQAFIQFKKDYSNLSQTEQRKMDPEGMMLSIQIHLTDLSFLFFIDTIFDF